MEVYRSFDGKLDVENQAGYVITELKDFYEVEFLSVWGGHGRVRIRKERLAVSDFGNLEKIDELREDIECGRADYGQCYYDGKWYGYEAICKIQTANQSNEWKPYV